MELARASQDVVNLVDEDPSIPPKAGQQLGGGPDVVEVIPER